MLKIIFLGMERWGGKRYEKDTVARCIWKLIGRDMHVVTDLSAPLTDVPKVRKRRRCKIVDSLIV
jgi:hypothetical protein